MELAEERRVRECLEAQLAELELLRSMFPGRGEVRADDAAAAAYVSAEDDSEVPPPIGVSVAVRCGLELSAELPLSYPLVERAQLMVRAEALDRRAAAELGARLGAHLRDTLPPGDPCLCEAIAWLQCQDIGTTDKKSTPEEPRPLAHSRLWIYSHHIYSVTKRKEMSQLARHAELTGFALVGKPGVVCVEGERSAVDAWWQRVKAMSWKRIAVRKREDFAPGAPFERRFPAFEELAFATRGACPPDKHADVGELFKYLEAKGCSYVFVDYFGVDGKACCE